MGSLGLLHSDERQTAFEFANGVDGGDIGWAMQAAACAPRTKHLRLTSSSASAGPGTLCYDEAFEGLVAHQEDLGDRALPQGT